MNKRAPSDIICHLQINNDDIKRLWQITRSPLIRYLFELWKATSIKHLF